MREVFENRLKEDRYDSTTRKVYADWLEEHGFDDEAIEQRRCATSEWIDADEWMHNLANIAGETCTNYNTDDAVDKWEPITYEILIKAGFDYLENGKYFYQIGSETLRSIVRPDKYWSNWSIIIGRLGPSLDRRLEAPFSCSC